MTRPPLSPAPVRVLPDAVVNQIAAGEVVERPAAVVKELVENALDAGADRIEVEVAGGGRGLIAVTDNGTGMGRDDALLSIERHATSKIRSVEDIERIGTLGFRGEALAAISSVSHFELQTARAGDAAGTELVVSGGRLQDVRDAGAPPGTRIRVRRLFFNVPARRKFLRAESTELSHVRQVAQTFAAGHPAIAWRLVSDGRELWNLPPAADRRDRIRELYGERVAEGLRPVVCERGEWRLEGFAGVPALARGDRQEQVLFVNGRPATAPVLQFAVQEAYHTLLPRGRHPSLFLFLRIPPGEVDVNVHPTKREVRFRHAAAVRDLALEALRGALGFEPGPVAPPPPPPPPPEPELRIVDLPPARAFHYPKWPSAAAPARSAESPADARPWTWCRIVGQVGGLFVVLETAEGLALMDPHAAHERVLFERYLRDATAGSVRSQGLLLPETVPLGPADARAVRDNLERLRGMGFGIGEFGDDHFVVDALPAALGRVGVPDLLREVARTLNEAGARGGTERWAEERIAQAACKAAVKARDRLTLEEIEALVVDLASAELPYTCPHGRPTLIQFSYDELNRKFGRA